MPSQSPYEAYYGKKHDAEAREKISGEHFPDFGQFFPDIAERLIRQAGFSGNPSDYDFFVRPTTEEDLRNGIQKSHVVEIREKPNKSDIAPLQGDNSWTNPPGERRSGIDYRDE